MAYIAFWGLLFAFGVILIGEALLGLAVGVYLPLKERGVLETPEARARMKQQKALRSFPTKGWF